MELRVVEGAAFQVAGEAMEATPKTDFADFWARFTEKVDNQVALTFGNAEAYGVNFDMTPSGAFSYLAGYRVENEEEARKLGLVILEIPAHRYAVLTLRGPVAKTISEGWTYFNDTFLKKEGYEIAQSPDFERYFQGNLRDPHYEMELWIPIVKA